MPSLQGNARNGMRLRSKRQLKVTSVSWPANTDVTVLHVGTKYIKLQRVQSDGNKDTVMVQPEWINDSNFVVLP